MLIQLLAIAWLGGASVAALGGPLWLTLLTAPLAWGWRRGRSDFVRFAFALPLVAVAFGGALWYRSHTPQASRTDISHFIGAGPTRIVGIVDGDSQERQQARLVRLKVARVEDDLGFHPASGVALLRLFKAADYADGEQIEVRGKLIQPKELTGLDYREYLARQGIFAEVDYPRTRRLAPEPSWRRLVANVPFLPRSARASLDRAVSAPCLQTASRLRQCLVRGIASVLPEPEASVGADIAFGTRRPFEPVFARALAETGTAPIVVATGYNVTILAIFGVAAFSWLISRRWALLVTLILVFGYSAFIGWTPSVLRAAVMAAIVVGAGVAGRPHAGVRTLALAAALMVLISPMALNDLSFPLSLASTAGLFVFSQPLAATLRRLLRVPVESAGRRAWLGGPIDSLALTTAASAAALPVMLLGFQSFSLSTFPANALLFPMVPWIMAVSGLTAVAAMVAGPAPMVVAPLAYSVLRVVVLVIELCARLPGAAIQSGPLGTAAAALAGVLLLASSDITPAGSRLRAGLRSGWARLGEAPATWSELWRRIRQSALLTPDLPSAGSVPGWLIATAAGLALGLTAGVLVHGEVGAAGPEARITVLDVGAGSAILVESGGSRILLGGGPAGGGTLRALDATLPPWDRSLNLVVVANGSAENVGGLQEVLAHYHVDGFVNAAPEPTAPTALRTFLRAAAAAKLRNVPAGDLTVNAGDATMRIQAAGQDSSGKAASSATVELEVGARRLVLAGEAGDDPAADLRLFGVRDRPVPAIPARVELLQAGPVSSAEGDLAAVPEGLRSAAVYRTTENGTVTIITDGRSIAVYVQRGPMLGLFAGRR